MPGKEGDTVRRVSIVLAALIIHAGCLTPISRQPAGSRDTVDTSASQHPNGVLLTVIVLGRVKVPGSYQIRSGSVIQDAVSVAGGSTQADSIPREAVVGTMASGQHMQHIVKGTAWESFLLHDGDVVVVTGWPCRNTDTSK